MKNFKPRILKNKNKKAILFNGLCKGCGLCLIKCPQKAISFSKTEVGVYNTPAIEIDLEKCNQCGICQIICPDSAIKIGK